MELTRNLGPAWTSPHESKLLFSAWLLNFFFFFYSWSFATKMDISQCQLSLSLLSMLLYASNSVISPFMHFLSEKICYFKIFFFSLLRYPEIPIIFQLKDFFFLSSLSVTLFLISLNYVSFCKFLHFFFVSDFIFSRIYSLTCRV